MLIVRIYYRYYRWGNPTSYSLQKIGEGHKKDNGSLVILGLCGKVSSPSFT
jgi:hypothetical protein